MTTAELKPLVGQFGMITVGPSDKEKTLHGRLLHIDRRGKIFFLDTEDYSYLFKSEDIKLFEVKEFEPLPEKYNGREIYWLGGVAYFKDDNKKCNLKK